MTLKDAITQANTEYHDTHERVIFLGYNTVKGSRMYGTLEGIPKDSCIETPVCENLMVSMALGMSLEGYRPVVCFERHDFMLLALDAMVNHMDKLPYMSGDQFKFPVLVRAIVGGSTPLNPGPQHTQNHGYALARMLQHTSVVSGTSKERVTDAFKRIGLTPSGAVVLIEHRDLYQEETEVT